MKIMILLICVLLFNNFSEGLQENPGAQIDRKYCQEQYNTIKQNIYFLSSIRQIYQQQHYINKLRKIDDKIKDSIKIIFEGFQDMNIQNSIFELRIYDYNKYPTDIQAIAFYEYLKELNQILLQLQKLISQSDVFFKEFIKSKEIIVNNFNEIIKSLDILKKYPEETVESELDQLDYKQYKCREIKKRHEFQMTYNSLKPIRSKNNQKNKKLHISVKLEESFVFLQVKPTWDFKEEPPLNETSCQGQLGKINEEYIELLKIQELLVYQSKAYGTNENIRKLESFQSQFLSNSQIIINTLDQISIQDMSPSTIDEIMKFQQKSESIEQVDEIMNQIQEFNNNVESLNQQINDVKLLFNFLNSQSDNILYYNNKINLIIDNFYYQPEQIYKKLVQVDRDYRICKGTQKYEIIEDIKMPPNQQLQQQNNIIEITPPIKEEQCSKQFQGLQETLNQTTKYKILKKIPDFYTQILKRIQNIFIYDFTERKKDSRYFSLQEFTSQFQRNVIQKFQVYHPNYKPDDSQACDAYESLNLLNNKLLIWQKYSDSAEKFARYKENDMSSLQYQFDSLKEKIEQIDQQIDHYKDVSYYVREQEYIEQLRDYKVCAGKDFIYLNLDLQQQLQQQMNSKIFISTKTNRHLIKGKKKILKGKQLKSQDLDETNNSFLYSQIPSFVSFKNNWKYIDYSEVEENECEDELEIIKEDLLQFLKIKTLFQYKSKHQKVYNYLITNVLKLENQFLEKMDFFKEKMHLANLEGSVLQLQFDFPQSQKLVGPIEKTFKHLIEFNNELILFRNAYINAKNILNLNKDDFSEVRYNHYILNEYLDKNFHYQLEEVEKELIRLYRDYEICTGTAYQLESEENKKLDIPSTGWEGKQDRTEIKEHKVY